MKNITDNLLNLEKQAEEVIERRIKLIQLQVIKKISHLLASLFRLLLIVATAFFIIVFLSVMTGYFFAEKLGSTHLGFGVIAAFYLLLLVMVLLFGKKMVANKLVNAISKILLKSGKGMKEKQ